jgi:hypothetical protein
MNATGAVISGQWSVVSGQRSAVSFPSPFWAGLEMAADSLFWTGQMAPPGALFGDHPYYPVSSGK